MPVIPRTLRECKDTSTGIEHITFEEELSNALLQHKHVIKDYFCNFETSSVNIKFLSNYFLFIKKKQ